MNKIVYYRQKCIGCGICREQQPELWRLSKKDGKATLIRSVRKNNVFVSTIPQSNLITLRKITKACPVRIIKIL